VPTPHSVQGPPAAPEKPALHTQSVLVVLSCGETEFGGHIEHGPELGTALQAHISDTGTVEFEPASHNVHVKPSPRKPSLQLLHTSVITSGSGARSGHASPGPERHEHLQMSQIDASQGQIISPEPLKSSHRHDAKAPTPRNSGSTQGAGVT